VTTLKEPNRLPMVISLTCFDLSDVRITYRFLLAMVVNSTLLMNLSTLNLTYDKFILTGVDGLTTGPHIAVYDEF